MSRARSLPAAAGPIACAFGLAAALAVLALVHLTQGTSALGDAPDALAVVLDGRLPRTLAALLVGCALGVGGAVLQTLARNPLASPDTLAVNAGAQFSVTVATVTGVGSIVATWTVAGVPLGAVGGALVALVGGLVGAGAVLLLSRGGTGSSTRLVLAGTALTLALGAGGLTGALLLLFGQQTVGLYAWGAGTLTQAGLRPVAQVAPLVGVLVGVLVARSRTLDLLALGDDTAAGLGVRVGRARVWLTVAAVALAACAVAVAGPIGFVGLCAPAAVRLLAVRVPGLARHRALLPVSALSGAVLVLGADVGVRALLGPLRAMTVPTGVVTSLIGALALVALARVARPGGTHTDGVGTGTLGWGRRHARLVLALAVGALVAATLGALLVGEVPLLLGDLVHWWSGRANGLVQIVLESRLPRVTAAVLAGAGLALAGALTQVVTRNPLADPAVLGITGGAALGGVSAILALHTTATPVLLLCAGTGAVVSGALLFGVAGRASADPTRFVLIGIGVSAAATALVQMIIAGTDPWNQAAAITWLGGSTYGATLAHQIPVLAALAVVAVVLVGLRFDLDPLHLDEDTARLTGVATSRVRLVAIGCVIALSATATMAVGLVAFVGLVAPHAARLLVGPRHRRMLGLTAVLGALLVLVADAAGRTVIAPGQLPAGMMTAIVGAPYFLWLLRRLSAPSGGSR